MALEVTECFADGKACAEELEATCNAAWAAYSEFDTIIREQGHARLWNWTARTGAYAAACTAFGDYMEPATSAPYEGSDAVAQVVSGIPSPLPDTTNREAYEAYEQALYQQRAIHSSLLREIFGNPFRPVPIAPAWRTSTVTALAQAIYDERAFDRLPILADALEDVGCSNHDILDHCRGPGPHVRGCWVVDLLLD